MTAVVATPARLVATLLLTATMSCAHSTPRSQPTDPGPLETVDPNASPTELTARSLDYIGTFRNTAPNGDDVAVAFRVGAPVVGSIGQVSIDALNECQVNEARAKRAVFVVGQGTITVNSSLPVDLSYILASNFGPAAQVNTEGVANAGDSWTCTTGSSLTFRRQVSPGVPLTFNFVLIAYEMISPKQPKPDPNLMTAWQLTDGLVFLSAGLYPKTTLTGPHAARCDGPRGDYRLSITTAPPYSFHEPATTIFGDPTGSPRHTCRRG